MTDDLGRLASRRSDLKRALRGVERSIAFAKRHDEDQRVDRLEERAGDLEGKLLDVEVAMDRLVAPDLDTAVEGTPIPDLMEVLRDGVARGAVPCPSGGLR